MIKAQKVAEATVVSKNALVEGMSTLLSVFGKLGKSVDTTTNSFDNMAKNVDNANLVKTHITD